MMTDGSFIPDWLKHHGDHGDDPQLYMTEEIGDGNINDVHRIINKKDRTQSAILKHAPPYVKCLGPDFPLSTGRAEIEYKALSWFYRLAPGSVPKPYRLDPQQHSFLMEDLQGYEVLRKQLVRGEAMRRESAQQLVRYVIPVHRQTTERSLGKEKFEKLKQDFKNSEMVSLTRDFVFTHPFVKDHPTNRCSSEVTDHVALIYEDDDVLRNVACLKQTFLEKKDCLLHGDLHTGSIMSNGHDAKMIDLEFAFVGPMGFDVGLLLANYLFAFYAHRTKADNNPNIHENIRQAAVDTVSEYFGDAQSKLSSEDVKTLFREVMGFAGCELVRRIVGAAHVEDLEGNPAAEVTCLKLGVKFILNYETANFTSIHDLPGMLGL